MRVDWEIASGPTDVDCCRARAAVGGGGVPLQVGGACRGPGGQWTATPTFRRRRRRRPSLFPAAAAAARRRKPQLNRGARATPSRGALSLSHPLPPTRSSSTPPPPPPPCVTTTTTTTTRHAAPPLRRSRRGSTRGPKVAPVSRPVHGDRYFTFGAGRRGGGDGDDVLS